MWPTWIAVRIAPLATITEKEPLLLQAIVRMMCEGTGWGPSA